MGLVDYGSSEDSEKDAKTQASTRQSKPSSSKPAFQKLVDSSNPNKVRVILEPAKIGMEEENSDAERPTKRVRREGGALGGFNSLLPAPKRSGAPNGAGRGGLGKEMSLKTSSAPGFTREAFAEHEDEHERGQPLEQSLEIPGEPQDAIVNVPEEESSVAPSKRIVNKSTMFKPLSVARKPQKKKPPLAAQQPSEEAFKPSSSGAPPSVNQSKGISLFSTSTSVDDPRSTQITASKTEYQPMLYQPNNHKPTVPEPSASDPNDTQESLHEAPSIPNSSSEDQSLGAIAQSLNLTPSQKRQLLGRNALKSTSNAIKVTNFSTDAEYAANETLRQAGETVQHQPVRAITGGGKHSLKQLVSSAVGQKDALDESFAEGRRNRKEGASKYGW